MSAQRPATARDHAIPLTYLLASLAVIALVLPTVLRPPQPPPPSSAEFAPDAPPDEQAILSELATARSRTAGGEILLPGVRAEAGPVSRAIDPRAPRGACVGDPARQVESLYAAPCAPAFVGDNGGATSKHVFANEVRVAMFHSLDNCNGKIPTTPPSNEGGGIRTVRVLQAYFNQKFETYGRWIQFYCLPGGTSDAEMRNNAVTAHDEWKIFVSSYIALGYCREMVRRQLPVFCDPPNREESIRSSPYLWSWQMDRTAMDEIGAEYYCKKLHGRKAAHAGPGSGYRDVERKLGVITEETSETGISSAPFREALRRECGAEVDEQVIYSAGLATDQIATGIAKLKAAGVTTVVLNVKFLNALPTFQAADSASYFPEWLLFSPYGLDVNIIGSLMSQSQMQQAFGLSGWEWPRATNETACFRAYKEIDPDNSPDGATCSTLFDMMVQMVSGIQAAGPTLTPETFRSGLIGMGYRWYDDIPWAIGGGYGPADHAYIDDVGEIWWDTSAIRPEDGGPGAYRWVDCGRRYRKGEFTTADPRVFEDGARGPGRDGCPQARGY